MALGIDDSSLKLVSKGESIIRSFAAKYFSIFLFTIESLTQASIFSPPQLAYSLLDSVAEAQLVQVSTRPVAVNSSQPKHSQDCLNVST